MSSLDLGFESVDGDPNAYKFNYGLNCYQDKMDKSDKEEGFANRYDYGYNCHMKNMADKGDKLEPFGDKSDKAENFVSLENNRLNIDLPIWGLLLALSIAMLVYPRKLGKMVGLKVMPVQVIAVILAVVSVSQLGLLGMNHGVRLPKLFNDKEGFKNGDNHKNYLNWEHADAANYLPHLVGVYGQPSILNRDVGGSAIWLPEDLRETCYTRLELKDESIPHALPKPHMDYYYTTVAFEIPPERIMDVLSLSGSVSYDQLKRELTARCATIEANDATLYLATEIAKGRISIDTVRENDLYAKEINATKSTARAREHYRLLCNNVRSQPLYPRYGSCSPLAFPKKCTARRLKY